MGHETEGTRETPQEIEGAVDEPAYFDFDGVMVAFIPRARGVVEVHCHGDDDHFRDPDGGCVHTDEVLGVGPPPEGFAPLEVIGYRGYGAREAMEADHGQ